MNRADSYAREITSLDQEIKRLNAHLRGLRQQRKAAQERLYNHMNRNNLQKVGKITMRRVAPRKKTPRKPESIKRQDAIKLFKNIGVPQPEQFWREFKETQKYSTTEINEGAEKHQNAPRKTNPNKGYDPYLGV